MLSLLYDVKLDINGIRFVLFRIFTVYLLRFDNIDTVYEIGSFSIGTWDAYNFKNRLCSRSFLIEMKHGWFTRKALVTPEEPEDFIKLLLVNNVKMVLRV
jgi:hypothetical protein